MIRIVFCVLASFFFCGVSLADEMMVTLQSGNKLVIQYSGVIEGVFLQSGSDGIKGIATTAKTIEPPVGQQELGTAEQALVEKNTTQGKKDEERKGSSIKLRWAAPKTED